jgi:hypothetical protein
VIDPIVYLEFALSAASPNVSARVVLLAKALPFRDRQVDRLT